MVEAGDMSTDRLFLWHVGWGVCLAMVVTGDMSTDRLLL